VPSDAFKRTMRPLRTIERRFVLASKDAEAELILLLYFFVMEKINK
jgi:hypothetical protein